MKKLLIILLFALLAGCGATREISPSTDKPEFPRDWLGTWEGTLRLSRPGDSVFRTIPMALTISSTDTAGTWNWIIEYGKGKDIDRRPYLLIALDSALTHFVVDERNSILLDQYRVGNLMYSQFSVDNTMLTARYHLEGEVLRSEIWTGDSEGEETGKALTGEEKSLRIFSYPFKVVQIAVLRRK